MKILPRYIARTYLKFWLLCLAALAALVVVANLFGNLDSVFSSRADLLAFLDETVRALPVMLDLLIPMTVLLATLFTFSSLGRSSELVAMRSVGVGLLRQLRPIFAVLVLIAALDYANQNYLHPFLQPADDPQAERAGDTHQWTLLRDQIVYVRRTDPAHDRIIDAYVFRWAPEPFRLERLVRARRVQRREEGPWLLHDVVTRRRDAKGWSLEQQPTLERPAEEFPDLFQQDALDAHHMPLFELSRHIRQLESRGRRVELYELEWYQKTAALFAPFVLVWFGAPLSQAYFRQGRASGEIMVGILGGLLFLIATETVFTLGRGGFLPPLAAAWSVNAAYIVLGSALFWRVR